MEVKLVVYTPNPLGTIAFAKGLMRGMHRDPNTFSQEDKEAEFKDCTKTLLLGPFEFVNFVFDFTGVTRAFTHQLVRTRNASYVQESMRFSVKTGNCFEYLIPTKIDKNPGLLEKYKGCMNKIQQDYEALIEMGASAEDARGILPTNILTSVVMGIDYRNLVQMSESRLCFQTQGEHREAILKIKKILQSNPELKLMGDYLGASCEHTGTCGWESYLDRTCPLQKRYPFRSTLFNNRIGGVE